MDDNGGTPPAEPEQPSSPFGEDGSLVENWNTLAPEGYEELKESQSLPRFKKFWDMAKGYEHVRKQVPLEKIARPHEHFTDSDWDEWYKAGGKPDTPEDYNITRPQDFPEDYWDDNRSKGFQQLFHRLGLNKKQVDEIVKYNNEEVLKTLEVQDQKEEADFIALKDKLHQKWGAAYDQKVHIGNVAIQKAANGDMEYKERLLDKINKDPDLIEFASNLGSLFTEPTIAEDNKIPTPGDWDTKINEAMGMNLTPEQREHHPFYDNKHPLHQQQVDLVMHLRKEKSKSLGLRSGFQT